MGFVVQRDPGLKEFVSVNDVLKRNLRPERILRDVGAKHIRETSNGRELMCRYRGATLVATDPSELVVRFNRRIPPPSELVTFHRTHGEKKVLAIVLIKHQADLAKNPSVTKSSCVSVLATTLTICPVD